MTNTTNTHYFLRHINYQIKKKKINIFDVIIIFCPSPFKWFWLRHIPLVQTRLYGIILINTIALNLRGVLIVNGNRILKCSFVLKNRVLSGRQNDLFTPFEFYPKETAPLPSYCSATGYLTCARTLFGWGRHRLLKKQT